MRKWKKGTIAGLAGAVLLMTSALPVLASDNMGKGTAGKSNCSASISCTGDQAVVTTKCMSADNDYIMATIRVFYCDAEGQIFTVSKTVFSDRGDVEVSAEITADDLPQEAEGDQLQLINAYGTGKAMVKGSTWRTNLYAEE